MKNSEASFCGKINKIVSKARGVKKRYYVIFGLLVLFFIYNTVSLRGFYYAKNKEGCFFGFMDWWQGHTNAINHSLGVDEGGRGYIPDPVDIHDTEAAHEWYGSIFGTVVFMKWKWVGLHIGDYAIMIDTSVPDIYGGDHILGHPYYILQRYDSVKYFSYEDKKSKKLLKEWEGRFGTTKRQNAIISKNVASWRRNVRKYRIITMMFYCVILLAIIVIIVCLIRKWRRGKRRRLEETLQ